MTKNLVYILLILFLSACSQNYGKGSKFLFTYTPGYHIKDLKTDNEFEIRYEGHSSDNMLLVTDYAVLTAAEFALKKNYSHFSIFDLKQIKAGRKSVPIFSSKEQIKYPNPTTPSPNVCIIKIKLLNKIDFDPNLVFAIEASDAVKFIRGRYGEVNQ